MAAVLGLALLTAVALPSLMSRADTPTSPARPASEAAYRAQARTDMIAGCTDKGAPRDYCECVTQRVLSRDTAELRAMDAEVRRMRPGTPPPAILVQAGQACTTPG